MYAKKSFAEKLARLAAAFSLLLVFLAQPAFAVLAAGDSGGTASGAVFTMTNAAGGNEVMVFQRAQDGALTPAGAYATGGLGSGAGLGSQSALALSENQRWLLAVNAGSSQISVFAVSPDGLELTGTVDSGGATPISVTIFKNTVFVLNAGGAGNITGFRLTESGALQPIPGSTRSLSNGGAGASTAPAQISFSPDGKSLVVTEKGTNLILTYRVSKSGIEGPEVYASSGPTPFGFAFSKRNVLVVSEAFGGAPGASAASSYRFTHGSLELVSASAPTLQTAACWVAVSKNGKFAYTTNAGSSSITGYRVDEDGSLTRLDEDGFTASTGSGSSPIDMAFSGSGRYLFALSGRANTISIFALQPDGSLAPLGTTGVPSGSVGLAAY